MGRAESCISFAYSSSLSIRAAASAIYLLRVETVFSYPGIGALSYESARFHDYNLLMVLCMMTGILVIFCNLIGQIINEKIDPRIKANEVVETSEVTKV